MRYLAPAALTHGPGQSRKPSTREGPTAGGGFLSGFASGELRPCPGHIGALVQRGGSPPMRCPSAAIAYSHGYELEPATSNRADVTKNT
jgi:hypothetical protein